MSFKSVLKKNLWLFVLDFALISFIVLMLTSFGRQLYDIFITTFLLFPLGWIIIFILYGIPLLLVILTNYVILRKKKSRKRKR